MSDPIYQLWVIKNHAGPSQNWNNMTDSQQKEMMDANADSMKRVGAEMLIWCKCAWANEEYDNWGIARYPDLGARIEHTENMYKMKWFDYVEAFTLLGTAQQQPKTINMQNPIYNLWTVENSPASTMLWQKLTEEEREKKGQAVQNAMKNCGGDWLIICNSSWCSEQHTAWGVDVLPNLEALKNFKAALDKEDWNAYVPGLNWLGIAGS